MADQPAPQSWAPITDYVVSPESLEDSELRALSGVWMELKERLAGSAGSAAFMTRLKREWAVETGLIERLYAFDRGITEMLIEHGIDAALIPHTSSDEPGRVAAMIRDQEGAIDQIFDFVKGQRQLTPSYVKQLHSLFTRNQPFAEGRDQFGNKSQIRLLSGAYKQRPNNPVRPDGRLHAYCPPEHVASEMDNLLAWHAEHGDVAPEVEAAWLHHRFVQIHPFQDGNGRLARALATLVFVKANWLPLVVRNSDRAPYIDALEEADRGELGPLVRLFASLQRKQFVKALGIARDVGQKLKVDERVGSIRARLAARRDALVQEWRQAEESARRLHTSGKRRLEEVERLLEEAVGERQEFSFFVDEELADGDRSHYYERQIVSTARQLEYFANTQHYRSWVRLVARDGSDSQILLSFHVVGHEFQGVLACSGTWFRRVQTDDGTRETEGEVSLSDDVFQINYREPYEEAEERFVRWLEGVIERGLGLWESTSL